jgi:hypothetical protein
MPLMQAVQKLVARYDKRLNLHGVYVEKWFKVCRKKKILWFYSASELYWPSDCHLSAKFSPNFCR